MGWYSDKLNKLRQLSNPLFVMFITAKVFGGLSIGMLLAYWLPIWTWWIFMIIALIIAIPVYGRFFGK